MVLLLRMMKFAGMALNIGEKVRQRAKELRIGPTELGKMINTSKQNVYGIFRRKSLDTELLRKLSKALNYDFFQYYINDSLTFIGEGSPTYGKKGRQAAGADEIQKLKKELEDLREKYELIKKVNKLLEKQKTR